MSDIDTRCEYCGHKRGAHQYSGTERSIFAGACFGSAGMCQCAQFEEPITVVDHHAEAQGSRIEEVKEYLENNQNGDRDDTLSPVSFTVLDKRSGAAVYDASIDSIVTPPTPIEQVRAEETMQAAHDILEQDEQRFIEIVVGGKKVAEHYIPSSWSDEQTQAFAEEQIAEYKRTHEQNLDHIVLPEGTTIEARHQPEEGLPEGLYRTNSYSSEGKTAEEIAHDLSERLNIELKSMRSPAPPWEDRKVNEGDTWIDGSKLHIWDGTKWTSLEDYQRQLNERNNSASTADISLKNDPVNHPSHYTAYEGVEVIQLTRHMSFNRGNCVKYVARAGLKDPEKELEDLEKARWYLDDEIALVRRRLELAE